jgi:hypothetical protein
MQLALFLLLGLRYDPAVTETLFLRAKAMQESSTYHWLKERDARIRAEGEVHASRQMVVAFERKKFGEPPATVIASLEKIDDLDRLQRLAEEVSEASSWDEISLEE